VDPAEAAAGTGHPWAIWDLQGRRLDIGVQESRPEDMGDMLPSKHIKSKGKQKASTEPPPPQPPPPPSSKRIRKPTNKEDKLTRLVTADAEKKFLKHKPKSKKK